jgi:diguanylate cyclase (GGDEF)-like protein
MLADARADLLSYAYVTLATIAAFGLFGYALGRQADRLLDLSRTDPLTGLGNARTLHERLREELDRVRRYGQPLSLLLFDLDALKQVNDRHGHAAGNAALCRLAQAIRRASRISDVPSRWGGDEFALLAPSTSIEPAAMLGDRIRLLLSERQEAAGPPPVTVSVGVATASAAPDVEAAARQLWDSADRALYEAKRRGRDQVVAAPVAGSNGSGSRNESASVQRTGTG